MIRISLYPGETQDGETTRGHLYIYVDDKLVAQFPACAGPPARRADHGGHSAEPTPPGRYVLGAAEHHVSRRWPMSSIPWGARLRKRADGEVEYSGDGVTWHAATGPDGEMTRAGIEFQERTLGRKLTAPETQQVINQYRIYVLDPAGNLEPVYHQNDFGEWAWNLNQPAGVRTAYFVHTTPADEQATAEGSPVSLVNSHGCVHIRPVDRDLMMKNGWLRKGVPFTVEEYGKVGPAGLT